MLTSLCVVMVILYTVVTTNAVSVSYDEISKVSSYCFSTHTCLSKIMGPTDNDTLSCACDSECTEYNDCCFDAQPDNQQNFTNQWYCVTLGTFDGVYVKASCKSQWSGSETFRKKCEEVTLSDVQDDPVGQLPVTSPTTGISYRNHYCALCNNDTSRDMQLWKIRLECPSLYFYNQSRQNLTKDYVFDNLQYNGSRWGVWLYDDDRELYFYTCDIFPMLPDQLNLRECVPNLISECARNWNRSDVEDKCRSYTAVLYEPVRAYKNGHCALCNYVNGLKLGCSQPETRIHNRGFIPRSFSVLLDVNAHSGNVVGKKIRCKNDEHFDPLFKKCRNIVCGFLGFEPRNGRCVEIETTTAKEISNNLVTESDQTDVPDMYDRNPLLRIINLNGGDSAFTNVSVLLQNGSYVLYSTTAKTSDADSQNQSTIYNLDFLQCPKISLNEGEYVILNNQSVYIPEYDQLYNKSVYFFKEGRVFICANFLNQTSDYGEKFSVYMGYTSIVGLGISIVCLIFHISIFFLVPDLHNLSGKNLASLATSLLSAYCCFIIGHVHSLSSSACAVVGTLTFYFFLASFLWMSVLAFDVWRSLLRATRELRVSKGRQWRRFLGYSLYSWLTPVILVVVTVVIEQQENVSNEYKPGFGLYHCWFGHKKALSLFFVTPLGTVMFMNVVFFICSARIIVNTSSDVTNNQTKSSRQNFRLYSKLALLTGLTWIVGLLAGYLDYESLWYIFVLLNTLQGLFIFVSFSCTRKVRTSLQVKLRSVISKSAFNRTHINTTGSGSNSLTAEHPHENNRKISSDRNVTCTHFIGSSTMTSSTTNITSSC
ncbi:uncharacterized protein LOC106476765 [Limulus polyphemus]|uniref:Uncharacterized protein LOC106476765 n=1 Tax=Limulus polyphemus TaxID=6850 RepID=A0ABM1C220_LIMPO|nr:uncharacterized protein LOC106476765 [Limulus polyphemus]